MLENDIIKEAFLSTATKTVAMKLGPLLSKIGSGTAKKKGVSTAALAMKKVSKRSGMLGTELKQTAAMAGLGSGVVGYKMTAGSPKNKMLKDSRYSI